MAEQKNKPKPAGEALSCGLIFILRRRSHRRLLPMPPVTAPGERYNSVRQLGVMDSLRCSIMRRAASRVLSSSARSSSRQ